MDKNQLLIEWANNHKHNEISQAQMIAEYYPQSAHLLGDPDLWPNIAEIQDSVSNVNIVKPKLESWRLNILELYSDSVRRSVKFPPNTCFLHALGCLSSAMSRQFTYTPYIGSDECRPVNLFCVSGQPPSTGKSGVNNAFMDHIRIAYSALNTANAVKASEINRDIKELKDQLKAAKITKQIGTLDRDLAEKQEELLKYPAYVTDVNDATPEGLEMLVAKQDGWGNIISAEAEAINVMLGLVYGDSSKKANNGIFLAMWAGEWVSVQRSSREGFRGKVRGSCAVLAQPETVRSILEAGKQGRGISERFLLINEPHMLGDRDHHEFTPVDKDLKRQYIALVNNLVNEKGVNFTFDESAHRAINDYRNFIEKQMSDNGRYNDSMIRGSMGKAGEQVQKIASIMWAAQEWGENGRKRKVIGYKTTIRAIEIFDELSRTYLHAAENSGFAGLTPKINAVKEYLVKRINKDKKEKKTPKVTVQQLQQTLKNYKEFQNTRGLTSYLREVLLPAMESHGIIFMCRGEYYINPKVVENV